MRVDVYVNLNRGGFSIRAADGPQRGRVIGHSERVLLADVEWRVRPAGVDRIRARGQREVVAWARGTLQDGGELSSWEGARRRVRFSPFDRRCFYYDSDGSEAKTSALVLFSRPAGCRGGIAEEIS